MLSFINRESCSSPREIEALDKKGRSGLTIFQDGCDPVTVWRIIKQASWMQSGAFHAYSLELIKLKPKTPPLKTRIKSKMIQRLPQRPHKVAIRRSTRINKPWWGILVGWAPLNAFLASFYRLNPQELNLDRYNSLIMYARWRISNIVRLSSLYGQNRGFQKGQK